MSPAEGWDIRTLSRSDAYDAWSRMLSATHLPWSVTELSPDPLAGFAASARRRHLADLVLARALGVSTRSLHRAFEDSGESVSGFIRTRRLARARDDQMAWHTVGQVDRQPA